MSTKATGKALHDFMDSLPDDCTVEDESIGFWSQETGEWALIDEQEYDLDDTGYIYLIDQEGISFKDSFQSWQFRQDFVMIALKVKKDHVLFAELQRVLSDYRKEGLIS